MTDDRLHRERQDAIFNATAALVALDYDSPLDDVKRTWENLIRAANELRGAWDTDSPEIVNASDEFASKRADFLEAVQILSDFTNEL